MDINDIKEKYNKVNKLLLILPNIDYAYRRNVLTTILNIIDLLILRYNIFFMTKLKSILCAKNISVCYIHDSILDIYKENNWTEFECYHLKILFVNMIVYMYLVTNKHIQIKKYYDEIMEKIYNYRNDLNEIIIDYTFNKMIQDKEFYEILEDDTFDDILLNNPFNETEKDNIFYEPIENNISLDSMDIDIDGKIYL
jgi:hypothetical protein